MKLKSETYKGMLIKFNKSAGSVIASVRRRKRQHGLVMIGETKEIAFKGMKRIINRIAPKK